MAKVTAAVAAGGVLGSMAAGIGRGLGGPPGAIAGGIVGFAAGTAGGLLGGRPSEPVRDTLSRSASYVTSVGAASLVAGLSIGGLGVITAGVSADMTKWVQSICQEFGLLEAGAALSERDSDALNILFTVGAWTTAIELIEPMNVYAGLTVDMLRHVFNDVELAVENHIRAMIGQDPALEPFLKVVSNVCLPVMMQRFFAPGFKIAAAIKAAMAMKERLDGVKATPPTLRTPFLPNASNGSTALVVLGGSLAATALVASGEGLQLSSPKYSEESYTNRFKLALDEYYPRGKALGTIGKGKMWGLPAKVLFAAVPTINGRNGVWMSAHAGGLPEWFAVGASMATPYMLFDSLTKDLYRNQRMLAGHAALAERFFDRCLDHEVERLLGELEEIENTQKAAGEEPDVGPWAQAVLNLIGPLRFLMDFFGHQALTHYVVGSMAPDGGGSPTPLNVSEKDLMSFIGPTVLSLCLFFTTTHLTTKLTAPSKGDSAGIREARLQFAGILKKALYGIVMAVMEKLTGNPVVILIGAGVYGAGSLYEHLNPRPAKAIVEGAAVPKGGKKKSAAARAEEAPARRTRQLDTAGLVLASSALPPMGIPAAAGSALQRRTVPKTGVQSSSSALAGGKVAESKETKAESKAGPSMGPAGVVGSSTSAHAVSHSTPAKRTFGTAQKLDKMREVLEPQLEKHAWPQLTALKGFWDTLCFAAMGSEKYKVARGRLETLQQLLEAEVEPVEVLVVGDDGKEVTVDGGRASGGARPGAAESFVPVLESKYKSAASEPPPGRDSKETPRAIAAAAGGEMHPVATDFAAAAIPTPETGRKKERERPKDRQSRGLPPLSGPQPPFDIEAAARALNVGGEMPVPWTLRDAGTSPSSSSSSSSSSAKSPTEAASTKLVIHRRREPAKPDAQGGHESSEGVRLHIDPEAFPDGITVAAAEESDKEGDGQGAD